MTFRDWHKKVYGCGVDDLTDEDYDERYEEYREYMVRSSLTELDKLEKYLADNNYNYTRVDEDNDYMSLHQLIIFDDENVRLWDAICNRGSYGYEEGKLEIMGTLVDPKADDSVEGWLTADDIISRLED